jgi:YjbE family integral membrane protein
MFDTTFWVALLQIIWIDLLLSGDNAVVIALACRSLPPRQQRWGIILGAGAAIALRVVFAGGITFLLEVPWLKIIGGLLLFWIAVKMTQGEEHGDEQDEGGGHVRSAAGLFGAIRTIVIADAVMSLDNVIAIAGAAQKSEHEVGRIVLIALGLLISIPLIVYGSTLLLKVLTRYPILVIAGAALLGWIGAEVIITDPALIGWIDARAAFLHWAAPTAGAALVAITGLVLMRRAKSRKPVDLVA